MGGKRKTHHVLVPVIRRILFVPFISKVPEHILNLVVLLHGRRDLGVSHGIGIVELLKVLDVVDVVGDLGAAAGDAYLVAGDAGLLLLLGAGAVVGVGVGGGVAGDCAPRARR